MGTTYAIKISRVVHQTEADKLQARIDARLLQLEDIFSTYRDSSELMALNRDQSGQCLPLSTALFKVIDTALEVSALSDGAFDITVGPLVNLWGFGPGPILDRVPSPQQINAARQDIGFDNIRIDKQHQCIKKDLPGLFIDLSAIAKGYAVDHIARLLSATGIDAYMVEIGGEIRTRGSNPAGEYWRIGIEHPANPGNAPYAIVGLPDMGMATSGNYRNYFDIDGRRYSHTIDPVSGRPVIHKLASVTVLHPLAMLADAYATALMVMGPERGMELATRLGLPCLFIIEQEDGYRHEMTVEFKPFLIDGPLEP